MDNVFDLIGFKQVMNIANTNLFLQFFAESIHPPKRIVELVIVFRRHNIIIDNPSDLVFEFLYGDRISALIESIFLIFDECRYLVRF